MTHTNLTCDAFEARLPDYLEGVLDDSSLADAELHLASCAACRSLVRDLRVIVAQAAALPGLTPSRDLWPEIEARTGTVVVSLPSHRSAAPAFNRWRLGAIAAALVGITAISTWAVATRRTTDAPAVVADADRAPRLTPGAASDSALVAEVPPVTVPGGSPIESAVTPVSNAPRTPRPDASTTYTSEIERLRRVVSEREDALDPATVAILESSIATIDRAIAEARRALERDPASRFLSQQVDRSLERKLSLLRRAALLSPTT
ncbi:MAG: zf-HC2 domain-containing protein [Gemmatimonadaceae bacterium]|nr:zf-HC2 domain-containing protein [Gemmatimonadaceae bacterium]